VDVQLEDEGEYSVVVTDAAGPVISESALLSAWIRPALTTLPVNISAVPGEVVTASAAASGNPLPFIWDWRRVATVIQTNLVHERFSFLSFTNTNAVGSAVQYRVIVRNDAGQANVFFTITTVADSDGDGISDDWEAQYFGGTNAANASLDSDGDGLTNLEEYTAGTDPNDPGSLLVAGIQTGPAEAIISFPAATNKTYTIEFSDGLGTSWQKLTDVVAQSSERVESVVDPAWVAYRFYRIVTPRQP
jgi:hypothetical protein